MKNHLGVVILLIAAISVFTGCSTQNKATYASEQKDLKDAISNNSFTTNLPKEYTLTANIDLKRNSDAVGIDYEISIKKPTIKMENLIMSFHLEPRMFEKLNTSHVFTSNTQNDFPIAIGPTGDSLGASLGREFGLDKSKIDLETNNIYKTIYAKITYGNKENRVSHYIKLEATVSAEIQDYINRANGSSK